jgi:hypothetical protein
MTNDDVFSRYTMRVQKSDETTRDTRLFFG